MDFLFNPENKIRREVAVMIVCLMLDLQEDYRYQVKRGFLRNILQSESVRKRLNLDLEPLEFPIATIKAPVPWKCAIQVAKNRLEEVLMVNHPVLQAIQILWHNLYHDLLIVDTAKFYRDEIPYHAENITEIINSCCKISRDVSLLFVFAPLDLTHSVCHFHQHFSYTFFRVYESESISKSFKFTLNAFHSS